MLAQFPDHLLVQAVPAAWHDFFWGLFETELKYFFFQETFIASPKWN